MSLGESCHGPVVQDYFSVVADDSVAALSDLECREYVRIDKVQKLPGISSLNIKPPQRADVDYPNAFPDCLVLLFHRGVDVRPLPLPHVHDSRPEFDVLVMYACEFRWMKLGSRECCHRDRCVGWKGDRRPRLSYRAPGESAAALQLRHGAFHTMAR